MVTLPGIDSTIFSSMSGDSYAIDARGNTVAIVAGETNSRVMMWKSTDNGETWDTTQIMSFPYEPWDDSQITDLDGDGDVDSILVNGENVLEAIGVSDGSYDILIDNNGEVHVWFGAMRMSNDDPTDDSYSYYPGTSGIYYWKEGYGLDGMQIIADLVDDNGDGVLSVTTGYADIGATTGPVPYGSGLTLQPSAGIDADGYLYLSYAGAKEGALYSSDGLEPSRKHIYLTKSIDGGETWSTPIDVVGDEANGFDQTLEYVYCSMARNVDGFVHLVYQRDYFPGAAVTVNDANFHPFDLPNDIVYLKVNKNEPDVVTGVEKTSSSGIILYPNPTNSLVSIKLNSIVKTVFRVVDVSGRTCFEGKIEGQMGSAAMDNMPAGIYALVFEDYPEWNTKLIKQ